jgi:YggT family protein
MISQLIGIYILVLLARIVISWFPVNPSGPFASVYRVLFQVTEPVLGPARRMIPSLGPIDISPIIVFVALRFVQGLLASAGL